MQEIGDHDGQTRSKVGESIFKLETGADGPISEREDGGVRVKALIRPLGRLELARTDDLMMSTL
jgi:hypothetical protein